MSLSPAQEASLASEIATDPLTRGYSGMTAHQIYADLNTMYRDLNVSSFSGDEVFAVTDSTQFAALSDANKQLWLAFCGRDSIDPFGVANVAFAQYIFGAGTATVVALAAARTISNGQSRAQELGLSGATVADIQEAMV